MFLLSLSQPALLPTAALRAPWVAKPRAGFVRMQEDQNLTMGDALIGSLRRAVGELPDEEKDAMRADWKLNGMLEASEEELDALLLNLDRDLHRAAHNTAKALQLGLAESDAFFSAVLNSTALRLYAALTPSRDALRETLAESLHDLAARKEAKRRKAASLKGFARASSWRTGTSVPLAEMPKHPVVLLSEASALMLSLMLLLVAGDMATARHTLTTPPHIASVRMQAPRLTTEYSKVSSALDDGLTGFSASELKASLVTAAKTSTSTNGALMPRTTRSSGSSSARGLSAAHLSASKEDAGASYVRAHWWSAMRGVFAVYLATLAIILSNGSEEWAAKALGIDAIDDDAGDSLADGANRPLRATTKATSGMVRWEYDWEREAWVEC
jgi:hypothetical protein